MEWRAGTIELATDHGVRLVEGLTLGPWGLHEANDGRWSITHLPSGMRVGVGRDKADAKRIVAVMRSAVPDAEWEALRNHSPLHVRAGIGRRVMAALGAKKLERGMTERDGPKMRGKFNLNGYARE